MQQDIESSNQTLKYVNPYQKHLEVKNVALQLWKMYIFFHYHSLYAENKGHYAGIMLDAPSVALCPKHDYARIMYLTLGQWLFYM